MTSPKTLHGQMIALHLRQRATAGVSRAQVMVVGNLLISMNCGEISIANLEVFLEAKAAVADEVLETTVAQAVVFSLI